MMYNLIIKRWKTQKTRKRDKMKKTRFLNFEVIKNYGHVIGAIDGSLMSSWYELLEKLNHSNLNTKKQIEVIQSLLYDCSEVVGDYIISIDPNDEETKKALIETLNDLYDLEEAEEEE